MISKHFFKTLITFSMLIIVGLIGVFLASYFDNKGVDADSTNEVGYIAK